MTVAELKVAEQKVRRKLAVSPVDLAEFESRAGLELVESLRSVALVLLLDAGPLALVATRYRTCSGPS